MNKPKDTDKIKCLRCGHIQEYRFQYCQECWYKMDDQHTSSNLHDKLLNKAPQPKPILNNEMQTSINRFSFTAFFAGLFVLFPLIIWIIASRIKFKLYFLLLFIPLINIIVLIIIAGNGRRLSWEDGNWDNFDKYQSRHKMLTLIVMFPIVFLITLILIILFL